MPLRRRRGERRRSGPRRPTAAADRELDGRGVRVVVIRGEELVDPMLDHGVGAERVKVATTNQINVDFFEEL
jgi:restriction system protein